MNTAIIITLIICVTILLLMVGLLVGVATSRSYQRDVEMEATRLVNEILEEIDYDEKNVTNHD